MPICFTRDRECAISIARVGLQMRYREPKKLVFSSVYFKAVSEICAHLQAECRIKHTRYSLIIMIIQKHVKRMPICFARDRVCVVSIVRHFYCGSGVCWIDCSRVSYVRLINQCGLYVDKIRIFLKNSGCGLYTGALNRPKITVLWVGEMESLICNFLFQCGSTYNCLSRSVSETH